MRPAPQGKGETKGRTARELRMAGRSRVKQGNAGRKRSDGAIEGACAASGLDSRLEAQPPPDRITGEGVTGEEEPLPYGGVEEDAQRLERGGTDSGPPAKVAGA